MRSASLGSSLGSSIGCQHQVNSFSSYKGSYIRGREEGSPETRGDIDGMMKAFSFVLVFLCLLCLYTAFPFRGLLACNSDRLNMALQMFHWREEATKVKIKIASNIKSVTQLYKTVGSFLSCLTAGGHNLNFVIHIIYQLEFKFFEKNAFR